jgi:hypothetical protein
MGPGLVIETRVDAGVITTLPETPAAASVLDANPYCGHGGVVTFNVSVVILPDVIVPALRLVISPTPTVTEDAFSDPIAMLLLCSTLLRTAGVITFVFDVSIADATTSPAIAVEYTVVNVPVDGVVDPMGPGLFNAAARDAGVITFDVSVLAAASALLARVTYPLTDVVAVGSSIVFHDTPQPFVRSTVKVCPDAPRGTFTREDPSDTRTSPL